VEHFWQGNIANQASRRGCTGAKMWSGSKMKRCRGVARDIKAISISEMFSVSIR
tara:strand:+ start:422 stop:583 length:162 start_codon:yes stop_codon:yes gene_type:complete